MRPYSSVRALCGSSYTGFTGTWVLGQFGEIRPEYPKSCAGTHEKNSKVFSSLFHIKWDLTLVSGPSVSWAIAVSQVLGYWGNLGKLGPNTPYYVQEHMKSNPKSSAPCFTSNETLLQCQSPLWGELYLFHWYLGIGAIWENWARIPQITWKIIWKVIQSPQILILHQMRPYSSVKALLWGELYLFHRYSGIGAVWGSLARISRIMHRDTWKVIQSLQLLYISHQISFYSSV